MNTSTLRFRDEILEGIPHKLPSKKPYDNTVNHAPKRKDILNSVEKQLALKNSLRYFEPEHHKELINEFKEELETYGRIYIHQSGLINPDQG